MTLANIIVAHVMSYVKYFVYGLNVYNLVFMIVAYLLYKEYIKKHK